MTELPSEPRVAILLCTYNGEVHLRQQLDSISAQGLQNIDVWVSDDGSSDNTLEILESYQKDWEKGRFIVKSGPQQGFAANFLSLVCDSQIEADFFAYSDQDDIWEPDKLSRALQYLNKLSENKPGLFCSRTKLIAENGSDLNRFSPLFNKKPSFANAVVQSLAGGNTMVLNQQARHLLCAAGKAEIISHDWWTYLLVSGAGGEVFYDSKPTLLYRQHKNNKIGANNGWCARLCRMKLLLTGRFREWNKANIDALMISRNLLSQPNQIVLDQFYELRQAPLLKRLTLMKKSGIYRQTFFGNIALIGAVILNKL